MKTNYVQMVVPEVTPQYKQSNSQLLLEYREALIKAYNLGEDIKELYGIVPPKVMYDLEFENTTHRNPMGYPKVILGLTIS
jgi:hypothetical protein